MTRLWQTLVILPMAAIRGEGVTSHFMPPEVPSLPTFKVQKFVSEILVERGIEYRTGVTPPTLRRHCAALASR